jgi:nucleotide-binding universal stress UspA family protein
MKGDVVMFKRILFPTSGSPISAKVANMICQLIKEDQEREVLILTVAEIPNMPSNISMQLEQAGIHVGEVIVKDINDRIEKITSIFKENNIPYKVKVCSGDPVKIVTQEASDFNADLLIVGNHGQSTFTDFLFKTNITVQIINESNCPVMVVK